MTAAATFAVILLYILTPGAGLPRRAGSSTALAIALVAAVGFARLILNAHWPTDVLGGVLLGAGCAAAGAWWDARHPETAEPARPRAVNGALRDRRLMRSFVELEDVGFAYGAVPVLERINLTVEPGDFLGIIGPNGSGKTTLLRIMLGLLPPQRGSVRLFGHPPASFRQWGRLGYVPQRATLDPVAARDRARGGGHRAPALARPLRAHRRGAERTRITEVLGQVGMEAHARRAHRRALDRASSSAC